MPSKKNVTYYIGAGASANCLPCVNSIPERLKGLITFLFEIELPNEDITHTIELSEYEDWQKYKQLMIDDLNNLYDNTRNHATIDTYAKILYLTGRVEEYNHLLNLLSFYFIVEQIINRPDNRYETFLANILSGASFPKNINILSWNYDSQFEIAYREFNKQNDIQVAIKSSQNYQEYQLINLNGVATFKDMDGYDIADYRKKIISKANPFIDQIDDNIALLRKIIALYFDYVAECTKEKPTSNLSFAFEKRISIHNNVNNRIKEIVENTDALVIIGYTFPFFNRPIDRQILSNLKQTAKIYIQDTKKGKLYVKQNLIATLNNIDIEKNIILLNSTEQFYLPPEL